MDIVSGLVDIAYYGGLGWLKLGRPVEAADLLTESWAGLPVDRVRARAVLSLSVAEAHAADRQVDSAVELTVDALADCASQPIGRVWQRARDVRARLADVGPSEAADRLDSHLDSFARLLHAA